MKITDLDSMATKTKCIMNKDPHLESVSNIWGGDTGTMHKGESVHTITGLDMNVLSGEERGGGTVALGVSDSIVNCIVVPEVGHLPVRGSF